MRNHKIDRNWEIYHLVEWEIDYLIIYEYYEKLRNVLINELKNRDIDKLRNWSFGKLTLEKLKNLETKLIISTNWEIEEKNGKPRNCLQLKN